MKVSHELKTDPEVFEPLSKGKKTYTIRINDRDFALGDVILFRETKFPGAAMKNGGPLLYTGREHLATVTHILSGPVYGLLDGWAILSFGAIE